MFEQTSSAFDLTDRMECQFMSECVQGRLVLGDGSIYDGTWRNGKKSGLGTFYFSNGDVFQGSWREDVMHGKVCHFLFLDDGFV